MTMHPLAALGFQAILPADAPHPLAPLGFAPVTGTLNKRAAGRLVIQPTADPAVNQQLATEAMPAYAAQLAAIVDDIPGATLAAVRPAKKKRRLAEKITQEGQPPQTVSDYGAAQIAVDSPEAKQAVTEAVYRHYPVVRERDQFLHGDPTYHYRSDMLQVKMPNQSTQELQIVPAEVLEANPRHHAAFAEARTALADGDRSQTSARDSARAANDDAMETFTSRNGEQAVPVKIVKGAVMRGARVRLADGTVARVLYVDPGMRFVRVRTGDGRSVTVRRKDLELG